jgi:hypothetical protein
MGADLGPPVPSKPPRTPRLLSVLLQFWLAMALLSGLVLGALGCGSRESSYVGTWLAKGGRTAHADGRWSTKGIRFEAGGKFLLFEVHQLGQSDPGQVEEFRRRLELGGAGGGRTRRAGTGLMRAAGTRGRWKAGGRLYGRRAGHSTGCTSRPGMARHWTCGSVGLLTAARRHTAVATPGSIGSRACEGGSGPPADHACAAALVPAVTGEDATVVEQR